MGGCGAAELVERVVVCGERVVVCGERVVFLLFDGVCVGFCFWLFFEAWWFLDEARLVARAALSRLVDQAALWRLVCQKRLVLWGEGVRGRFA